MSWAFGPGPWARVAARSRKQRAPFGRKSGVSRNLPRFSYLAAAFGLALLLSLSTTGTAVQSAGQAAVKTATTGQSAAPTQPASQAPNGRPGPLWEWEWWKDGDVQKELVLTEAKVKNITRIFESRVRSSLALAERFNRERDELNKLAEERQLSVEDFAVKVMQVEALRVELNKGRAVMNYRISLQLSPEQNKKLVEIRERRMNTMRSGRGGRGAQSHR